MHWLPNVPAGSICIEAGQKCGSRVLLLFTINLDPSPHHTHVDETLGTSWDCVVCRAHSHTPNRRRMPVCLACVCLALHTSHKNQCTMIAMLIEIQNNYDTMLGKNTTQKNHTAGAVSGVAPTWGFSMVMVAAPSSPSSVNRICPASTSSPGVMAKHLSSLCVHDEGWGTGTNHNPKYTSAYRNT